MTSTRFQVRTRAPGFALALAFLAAFLSQGTSALAQEKTAPAPAATPDTAAAKADSVVVIPPGQLEALVAPIALYPDDLLAQTLVASTYPLELVQLQQWMEKHKDLKDKALADSVAKENWDPSIQSMAAVPDVVNRLANDIQWTTDLGNAFLAQQADVMDAVQRMRKKAMDKGALASNEQQKVDTLIVEQKTVIVVESTNPEVIYVPSYSPAVVYGPPPYAYYPYPPIYYPPYPPGAAFVSFSMGVMWGAAVWGGSCCGCGWGGNDVNINVDNNFNQINHNTNRGQGGDRGQGGNRGQGGSGGKWQHDASHRGAAPYGDKATAGKYGGSARGESRGQAGASNRASTGVSNQGRGTSGGAGVSNQGRGPGATGRAAEARGARARPTGGAAGAGAATPSEAATSPRKASPVPSGFSGGSSGYSGSSARASSSRGSASRGGGSRGGGGGGGRGGGRR